MGKFSHYDSPVLHFFNQFADLVLLNILTLLCSIPIITIGASTTALYYAVDKLQQNEGRLFRAYFRSFRENFLPATLLWLILLSVGIALLFCGVFSYTAANSILLCLTGAALFLWCLVVSWLFPLLAKYLFPMKYGLKNAFLCGILYFPTSLLMIVTNFIPFLLYLIAPDSFWQIGYVWIAIWFSLSAFCNLKLLKKPFQKLDRAFTFTHE